jgi:lipopolysaccharide transport system ATP-binding protein
MPAIELIDVTRVYQKYSARHRFQTFKSAIVKGDLFRSLRPDELVTAVSGVNIRVEKGETFGVIGENGSGKSTLLKLIAGIAKPTSGRVRTEGKISALIELGAGFHPEITGRENVFINGIMLGLSKREIVQKFDEIVRFAELEDFIDAPVKTYSSGMYMRLGFSVAINVNPEILLVDEVLAVGDAAFVPKCLDRIDDFRRRKKTILFVSHDLGTVEKICDKVLR